MQCGISSVEWAKEKEKESRGKDRSQRVKKWQRGRKWMVEWNVYIYSPNFPRLIRRALWNSSRGEHKFTWRRPDVIVDDGILFESRDRVEERSYFPLLAFAWHYFGLESTVRCSEKKVSARSEGRDSSRASSDSPLTYFTKTSSLLDSSIISDIFRVGGIINSYRFERRSQITRVDRFVA